MGIEWVTWEGRSQNRNRRGHIVFSVIIGCGKCGVSLHVVMGFCCLLSRGLSWNAIWSESLTAHFIPNSTPSHPYSSLLINRLCLRNSYHHRICLIFMSVFLPTYLDWELRRNGIFTYPQCLEECLVHNKHLLNVCWIKKWLQENSTRSLEERLVFTCGRDSARRPLPFRGSTCDGLWAHTLNTSIPSIAFYTDHLMPSLGPC